MRDRHTGEPPRAAPPPEAGSLRESVADYVALLASSGLWVVGDPAASREDGAREAPSAGARALRADEPARPSIAAATVAAAFPATPGSAPDLFTPSLLDGTPSTLAEIREQLGECTRCKLSRGRTHIVFGEGNPKAEILFIGEGPGEEEDRQARPFVGRAGQLLTKIIRDGMKLRREDVYIANIVKCRPPGNREPERDEVAACGPFLMQQIRAIGPRVIVTLGRPSTSTLLGRAVQITRVRGVWHDFHGIPLMPTYHPAFVLRQYTEKTRREVWEDMKQVLQRVGRAI